MKNSTHYRLRALACALLASAAMLGACDDDDPNDDPDPGKKPPVTLTDQIQYDGGDLVGIKSAIYVAEEDGSHTFYLSPTEGLINAEQMKQADDYLRVMVESPKGTVNTASDPFEIEYKDISVKKTTMNDVAAQTSDYWFRLYDHKTYQTYYGEDAGLTGTIETHPNPAGGKEIYLRVNLTLKNGIGVEAEYYGVPTAATADAMDEETLKPVKPFEPYIKFLDKDNKDMLYWPVTAMEVRHDPAYRDSYTGDLLSGYCFYFRNAFTESIDADNTTPMFFLPDSYLDHEGEIDLPAEGTNCKWNLRFQYMYLSSYNGYGYSDKAKYCMRCPEKAAVTVKQENKEWIFKFSMVDWGVFSTWNPDPTGTGNTLIIEFRGKADKYSGSKPNDLADDFYE